MNDARNRWMIQQGREFLKEEETARYAARYEELVSLGWEKNKKREDGLQKRKRKHY